MIPFLLVFLAFAQPGGTESPDFPKELQTSVLRATVRIVNSKKGGEGSGVVVKQDGKFVYIMTAWHVIDKAETVEVRTFSAESYPKTARAYDEADVIAKSEAQDLAVVRIRTDDKMPGVLPLCPVAKVPDGKDFPGLTCGCNTGKPPTCKADTVKGRKTIRRPGESTVDSWETATAPALGRSGGPLVDKRGYVLGIASGANDGLGYYIHTKETQAFLKQNDLEHLMEEERK